MIEQREKNQGYSARKISGFKRTGWLVIIWGLSVLVLSGIALLLRALMGSAGLTH